MKALTIVRARRELHATLLCLSSIGISSSVGAQATPSSLSPQPSQATPSQAQPSQAQQSPASPSFVQPAQPGMQPAQAPVTAGAPVTPPPMRDLQIQPSAPASAWTLESTEAYALERAPRVRSAQASRNTAQAYQAFGKLPVASNPKVNVRAMIGRPDDPAATYAVVLGVPFDVAGKRRAWRREAGHISEQAEAELAAVRNDVRSEARAAYVLVAMAGAARTVAEQTADTARELAERVQARLNANAATALDVALAQSQHAEATANMARAQRTLVEAEGNFRQALGLSFDQTIEVTPLAEPEMLQNLTLEAAVERARTHRREAAVWKNANQRWRAADTRLRREAVDPVTVNLEGERQGNTIVNQSVGGGVSFELPFVFRNQGERAVASKQADAAELERELAGGLIEREALASYRRLEAALTELSAIEEGALPAAERTLHMVQTMLDAGVVDYFRLLTARAGAFALRSRRVEAMREAWLCRIELERAIGGWEERP